MTGSTKPNSFKKSTERILAVTLARSGSKGVPGKNTRIVGGKPLIAHTIEAAKKSRFIDEYIVSTDSREIQTLVESLGAAAPFLRPPELSDDTASSAAALQHAVDWMEDFLGLRFDYVVEVMATNPLKTVEDVDACIDLLISSGADSVIAVNEVGDGHPARLKKIVDGRLADFCVPEPLESRRQDLLPKAYIRSGSIYALRRDELMENGRRYGTYESRAYVLPPERVINIDTEIDLLVAEELLSRRVRGM